MGCFHLLWSILVGFFAGLVARAVVGGPHMGFVTTTILGIVGSLIGGVIGGIIWRSRDARFHPAGFLLSIVGAILALWLWTRFGYRFGYH
jgi:uncharacterized membrane protein YeaQ/YmgE (transglycosylase-associated protein family)